jgi:hypothetical protein
MMHGATLSHRGSIAVTREQLAQFDPPDGTDTWKPVPHGELVEALRAELDRRGLDVKREQYAVQQQGNVLFGVMDLDWRDDGEYAAAIGLRTSNNKQHAISMAIGARVFVCDNLCFSGDVIALKRRHTSGLNLPKELCAGLDRYQDGFIRLQDGVEHLQRTTLTDGQAKRLIYDLFRQKVVPLRLFHPVVETYQASYRQQGATLWSLHNAFTTHVKSLPPAPAFRATLRLGQFFSLH